MFELRAFVYSLGSTEYFSIFQLIVFLFFWDAILLFRFSFTTLIMFYIFHYRKPTAHTVSVCNKLVKTVEHLAAKEPDISLRSW